MNKGMGSTAGLPESGRLYVAPVILPKHIRSARIWLDWDQADLARESGVVAATISDIERGVSDTRIGTLTKVKEALERAGIEFIEGEAPGVRLRTLPKNG